MKESLRRNHESADPNVVSFIKRAMKSFQKSGNLEDLLIEDVVIIDASQDERSSLRVPDKDPDGNCTHHWIIETPQGNKSQGVCKHCEGTKDFLNYTEKKPGQRRLPVLKGSGTFIKK